MTRKCSKKNCVCINRLTIWLKCCLPTVPSPSLHLPHIHHRFSPVQHSPPHQLSQRRTCHCALQLRARAVWASWLSISFPQETKHCRQNKMIFLWTQTYAPQPTTIKTRIVVVYKYLVNNKVVETHFQIRHGADGCVSLSSSTLCSCCLSRGFTHFLSVSPHRSTSNPRR